MDLHHICHNWCAFVLCECCNIIAWYHVGCIGIGVIIWYHVGCIAIISYSPWLHDWRQQYDTIAYANYQYCGFLAALARHPSHSMVEYMTQYNYYIVA